MLQLLGENFAATLWKIHVRMEIEGNEVKEILEPERNLKYHIVWDKKDVYGQKVYGRYVNCNVTNSQCKNLK